MRISRDFVVAATLGAAAVYYPFSLSCHHEAAISQAAPISVIRMHTSNSNRQTSSQSVLHFAVTNRAQSVADVVSTES